MPHRPVGPQPSGALAIIAFIASLIAFLIGWVPFIGLGLGMLALLLSILAVRKPFLRGLAVAGIVLSVLASMTSLVTTGLFTLALISSDEPTSSTVSTSTYAPEDFEAVDERTLGEIAKDPAAHAGRTMTVYGYVNEFDATTGKCLMRVTVSANSKRSWIYYDHNSLAFSGDGHDDCPGLDGILAEDEVKLSVVLHGAESYNSLGGYTTVPYFEIIEAELI